MVLRGDSPETEEDHLVDSIKVLGGQTEDHLKDLIKIKNLTKIEEEIDPKIDSDHLEEISAEVLLSQSSEITVLQNLLTIETIKDHLPHFPE